MTLANVALVDTFDTWRTRTNQIVEAVNRQTEGNYITSGTITISNTGVTGLNVATSSIKVKGNTFDANAITFVSNSSALIISGDGKLGTTVYFQTGALSTTPADANIANIASANTVNVVNELVVQNFGKMNIIYSSSNATYDVLNVAYGIANQAFNRANVGGANVSLTAPTGAIEGQLWWSPENGRLFIYYTDVDSSQWIETNQSGKSWFPVYDETSSGDTFYPMFSNVTSGLTDSIVINTDALSFVPGTGTLSVRNLNILSNITFGTSNTDFTLTGNIIASGYVTAAYFNSVSDAVYKEDIQPITNALDIVKSMTGVGFNWKETKQHTYGVVAQDMEKVVPDLVNYINNTGKTVNYDGIIAFLIEAIKELNEKLESRDK